MQTLRSALTADALIPRLDAHDLGEIFRVALAHAVEKGLIPAGTGGVIEEALLEREAQVSTAIGHGVAVPHAYLDVLDEPVVLLVRLTRPLNLGAPDGVPTRFLFLMLGPQGRTAEHLDMLTQIARLTADEEWRYEAKQAKTASQLLGAVDRFFVRHYPHAVPGDAAVPDALRWSGVPFGGIAADLRRRLPLYVSDFRDGLNPKSAASVLFLVFACVAPAITFGGIMGVATGGAIGAVEMLVATAAAGLIYALIGGQPLIILGGIGPLLIFTQILYNLCVDRGFPFLPAYAWVGLWTALWLAAAAVSDASALMRYFTRFTDEIFAALMSLIFIYEAVRALLKMFSASFDGGESHDRAFLSLLLAMGTFFVALNLSRIRRSRFLSPWAREFLSDFGPTIAIGAMTLAALWLRGQVPLDPPASPDEVAYALATPDEFGTTSGRPWAVDLFDGGLPAWFRWAAAAPALLAAVLIFLAQNITARLVDSPDNRLRKGAAYHWDLLVVAGLLAACSLFGLPWLVAATVRTLAHVRALADVEETIARDGQVRDKIQRVTETRITGVAIHILIGLSLLILPYLDKVPMAVLYGLFLYMGVVSMQGNQFIERLSLFAMDRDLYPQTHYIRRVPNYVIHRYTLYQLLCLVVLCVVNLVPLPALKIAFPVFIALLVPVRFALGYRFPTEYVAVLDAAEEPEQERTAWSV